MLRGLYRHINTGKLYKVVGIGRNVSKPNQEIVIYKQLYRSRLRGTDVELRAGALWTRSYNDFMVKFKKMNK